MSSPIPVPGTPQPRTPYIHSITPPTTPIRLPRTQSPYPSNPRLAQPQFDQPVNDYPESPTSPRHRRTAELSARQRQSRKHPISSPDKRFRMPRALKSPRRTLVLIALAVFIVYILKGVYRAKGPIQDGSKRVASLLKVWSGFQLEDQGVCRFSSPVEAYHRDLERLRTMHPRSNGTRPHTKWGKVFTAESNRSRPHEHRYSPTGHLLVSDSPEATHPIPLLLSLGEKRWEELLSRQSQSLEEAVREYQRRYGRLPPKGFDLWWDYATAHELVLPDEYDRINLDLAPFWALPKEEMKRRLRDVQNMKETFTLAVQDGLVDIRMKDMSGLKWGGTWDRAMDAAYLVKAFARYLPNLNATFSIFDQPQIYLSWARRESLVALGLRGEHTTHLNETDDAHVRLARSCSPDTHFRKNSSFVEGRSFIYDSLEAGDFCQNPYLVPLHGLTIEPHMPESHPRPHTALLPLFSLAKTSINSDILITPLDQFFDPPGKDPKWENKKSAKLAWRGSPTGISEMTKDLPWRQSHRIRLHHFANTPGESKAMYLVPDLDHPLHVDVAKRENLDQEDEEDDSEDLNRRAAQRNFDSDIQNRDPNGDGDGAEDPEVTAQVDRDPLKFKEMEGNMQEMLDFFLDIKLAGSPLQCSDSDGTCEDMKKEIKWAPHQKSEQLNRHKFLLDIDGNGWSGRFRRLMSTNSVVIKTGIFTEWFQPHLIPWFMYIPAKMDFSDLFDILAFFRGTPENPDLAFDETAQVLARNGQCFVQRMFRLEDLHAYMMRLFLEYARLAADEGIDMDYHYDATEDSYGEFDDETNEYQDEQETYDYLEQYVGADTNSKLAAEMTETEYVKQPGDTTDEGAIKDRYN